jgi:adenylate cyclase class 1
MPPPILSAHSFTSVRANSIARRVEQLFLDVSHCFSAAGAGSNARYLLHINDDYFLVLRGEENFTWFQVGGWEELMEELGQPLAHYRPVVVDRMTLQSSPLPEMFRQNREGIIQLFYWSVRGRIELFILDEQGALFYQKVQGSDERHLLVQQQRFLDGLLHRRTLLSDPMAHQLVDPPEYYKLAKNREGDWQVAAQQPPSGRIPESYLELNLICEDPKLQGGYSLIFRNQEYSTLEHGENLFNQVAKEVLNIRSERQGYPLYLTSVELSGPTPGQEGSTIEILHLKKRIESRLSRALNNLLEN